jgi:hypothetical protein
MRWRPLNLVEITALLFAITIGGFVWYGGSIAEVHRLNFGACGGRGSICIPAANDSIPKN